MPTITITTPGGAVDQRIADAFAAASNWTALLPNGSANPVSKTQNVKVQLIQHIRNIVEAHEATTAGETARAAAVTAVRSGITPT